MDLSELIQDLEAAPEDSMALNIRIADAMKRPAWLFTDSLERALTLVPKDWAWSVQHSNEFPGEAWLYPPNNVKDISFIGKGANPAIAVCIAALKVQNI